VPVQAPFQAHRLGGLAGLLVSTSGGGAEDKNRAKKLVEDLGGRYSAELTRQCTHLVLARGRTCASQKERCAAAAPPMARLGRGEVAEVHWKLGPLRERACPCVRHTCRAGLRGNGAASGSSGTPGSPPAGQEVAAPMRRSMLRSPPRATPLLPWRRRPWLSRCKACEGSRGRSAA
jgi:hypothetical protein